VEIREKERLEPPHVTILLREEEWRLGLRDRKLLIPPGGRPKDIDAEVLQIIEDHWEQLKEAWDAKYPENPVASAEDEDAEDQ
jgi:hypothetical protein